MRNYLRNLVIVLATGLAFSAIASAQGGDGQAGQQPGANRGRGRGRGETTSPTANLPFDAHDFSGVWMGRGGAFNTLSNEAPPMTPWGKARYEAAKPGIGPRAQPLGNARSWLAILLAIRASPFTTLIRWSSCRPKIG